MALEKLTITKITNKSSGGNFKLSASSDDKFVCQFNPDSLTLSKKNAYAHRSVGGRNSDKGTFQGGQPHTMDITLTFDSSNEGKPVYELYKNLRKLAMVDSKDKNQKTQQGEPPWVKVQWGSYIGFAAVITGLSEQYTMFLPSGAPIRAKVTLSLKQSMDDAQLAGQNPTSRSEPRRTWIVEHGQRLDWIAYMEYGDSSAWRHIANTNGIDDPTHLTAGQVLKLSPLE